MRSQLQSKLGCRKKDDADALKGRCRPSVRQSNDPTSKRTKSERHHGVAKGSSTRTRQATARKYVNILDTPWPLTSFGQVCLCFLLFFSTGLHAFELLRPVGLTLDRTQHVNIFAKKKTPHSGQNQRWRKLSNSVRNNDEEEQHPPQWETHMVSRNWGPESKNEKTEEERMQRESFSSNSWTWSTWKWMAISAECFFVQRSKGARSPVLWTGVLTPRFTHCIFQAHLQISAPYCYCSNFFLSRGVSWHE